MSLVAKCCLPAVAEALRQPGSGYPTAKVKFDKLVCKKEESGGIVQDQHRLRIECEHVRSYRTCVCSPSSDREHIAGPRKPDCSG